MQFLKSRKPPVPYKFVYLTAIVFSVVVILQSSGTNESGEMVIQIQHVILFSLNYLVWALLINWIYGVAKPLDAFSKMKFIFKFLLSIIARTR